MQKRRSRLLLISFGALLIMASVGFAISDSFRYSSLAIADALLYGISGTADEQRAEPVLGAILAAHRFRYNSPSAPDRPPVFIEAGSHFL